MPVHFLRQLASESRTRRSNMHLGCALCFVAGATNAGGFLAVHQYTSHMTGIISAVADNLALGSLGLVLAGVGALLSFLAGTICSTLLVNWGRRRRRHSVYAAPLLLEALLLLCFGLMGANLSHRAGLFAPLTVTLLCFIMGLQNAIVTKISHAEIRTTHVTGLITDIGIELGKLVYWNHVKDNAPTIAEAPVHALPAPVRADRAHLGLLIALLSMFFGGGVVGALGFKLMGYLSTLPLCAILIIVSAVPVADDVVSHVAGFRKRQRHRPEPLV